MQNCAFILNLLKVRRLRILEITSIPQHQYLWCEHTQTFMFTWILLSSFFPPHSLLTYSFSPPLPPPLLPPPLHPFSPLILHSLFVHLSRVPSPFSTLDDHWTLSVKTNASLMSGRWVCKPSWTDSPTPRLWSRTSPSRTDDRLWPKTSLRSPWERLRLKWSLKKVGWSHHSVYLTVFFSWDSFSWDSF